MAFQAGLYWIIDPLCGWSYGALPLMNRIAQHFPHQPILSGGLFIGANRRTLNPEWVAHVNEHDARIATLTGMKFGDRYHQMLLEDSTLMLDSLPATRGLLAAQRFAKPGEDLNYLNAVQRAWYVDGQNITQTAVVNQMLEQAISPGVKLEQITESEALESIQHARMLMAMAKGQGFPTAVIIDTDGQCTLLPVAQYYGQPDAFLALVKPQLTRIHR
ncbi:DsbA family protein [Kluyvera ascorbata]|uniref:DsbA family protein n=1 Tax=Kluyvera ascorbata TaxID=51288 RepID=UPI0028DE7EF3|nr:DsbA family protein [Kluyvera ascorbata]MDT8700914.1 DsbA family protein [Kluyvera ascorbata]MDZ4033644.1 DsbA family protein [Kluyvera ascorbata]HDG1668940.1 DsbA family protein [Kluyvera ascorbata]HDG1678559.1 DsbA family protein [Kluyvera ascorbata]HDG1682907.1 DsbA family protein [Kluyvera ascorbata]